MSMCTHAKSVGALRDPGRKLESLSPGALCRLYDVLFRLEKFLNFDTAAISFLFYKHCSIIK
jgi:hypothetical protein